MATRKTPWGATSLAKEEEAGVFIGACVWTVQFLGIVKTPAVQVAYKLRFEVAV